MPLESVTHQAAVIYPIPLTDRLEILVSLPIGLRRVTVPVQADRLNRVVSGFRKRLQQLERYLGHAHKLYTWLIEPLEPLLKPFDDIDTLVFATDGALRTIPMAALHDGNEQYLIHKYAVATVPSLELTDPRPLARGRVRVLAGGIKAAVLQHTPLRHVEQELANVLSQYNGILLLDETFRSDKLELTLARSPFHIMHIASHGKFDRDVKNSYILAFDGKLTLEKLEGLVERTRSGDEPLELLTLSACETALGDDRAALGLAGVAIKAGARSALATLWRVEDETTSQLMGEFYRQLQDPTVSKAVALQQAQLHVLEKTDDDHAFFLGTVSLAE